MEADWKPVEQEAQWNTGNRLAGLQVKLDEDDASPLREITQFCT